MVRAMGDLGPDFFQELTCFFTLFNVGKWLFGQDLAAEEEVQAFSPTSRPHSGVSLSRR